MELLLIIITTMTLALCLVLLKNHIKMNREMISMPDTVLEAFQKEEEYRTRQMLENPEKSTSEIEAIFSSYVDVMKQWGSTPDVSEHGILFEYQGFRWIIRRNMDPRKFRVELPGIMQVPADDPKLPKIIEACNNTARNLWGVQVFWVIADKDDDTPERCYHFFIACDTMVDMNPANAETTLKTAFVAVMLAFNQLRYEMTQLRDSETDEGPLWSADGVQFPPANLN